MEHPRSGKCFVTFLKTIRQAEFGFFHLANEKSQRNKSCQDTSKFGALAGI
jgi:hypothetical protein